MTNELSRVVEIIREHRRSGTGSLYSKVRDELKVSLHHARKLIEQARAIERSPAAAVDPKSPLFRTQVVRELRKMQTPATLASKMGASLADMENTINDLEASGYILVHRGNTVGLGSSVEQGSPRIFRENHAVGTPVSFGVVADMHLCSKAERLDVLEAAYDEFARRGIDTVLCPGNYVDGEARFNKHELLAHGIADQCQYAIDHWPGRKGIKTYYVDGDDHEGWYQQREGIEFGRYLALEAANQGRSDLAYLGYMEADVELRAAQGSAIIKVIHAGGGSSYAYSYASQKLAESFQGGEKPSVAIIGHYHKMEYCFPRNVHCVQAGCTQDQTRFMRKNKIAAHVGFSIITLEQDVGGSITRFVPEFFPFWDRGYYVRRDGQEIADRLQKEGLK